MLIQIVFGLFGFVIGFVIGLGVLNIFLRDKTVEELRTNKSLHKKYGLLCWAISLLGIYIGVWLTKFV